MKIRTEIDDDGTSVIVVLDSHLQNFPELMRFVINHEIGLERGYFKIRLDDSVIKSENVSALLNFIHSHYSTKEAGKSKKTPMPQFQSFHYGSVHEHVYGFRVDIFNTKPSQRQRSVTSFIQAASEADTYINQRNCCLTALDIGVKELVTHYWSCVRQLSIKSPNTFPSLNIEQLPSDCSEGNQPAPISPILYGGGIPLQNVSFPITTKFNLSELHTILDLNNEAIPGISFPYLYVGTSHATFPFHIEDAALFSINYIHYGAPCVWFFVPPEDFKKFTDLAHLFKLDLGHVSCNNVLGHKYIMASEEFLNGLGIRVNTVVQKTNEFLVTYPFAAHSGFKCGWNIQEAANFGDEWWVEPAILAPTCTCFFDQVKLNLTNIICSVKPHLLHLYKSNDVTQLIKELSHNEFIKKLGLLPLDSGEKVSSPNFKRSEATCNIVKNKSSPKSKTKFVGARCTLTCPDKSCKKSWAGGRSKLSRVVLHIQKEHKNSSILLKSLNDTYAPKETSKDIYCKICKDFISGNTHHLKRHMRLKHSD